MTLDHVHVRGLEWDAPPFDQFYEEMLDAAPDGVVAVDASGVIRFANRQMEQLFGWNRARLIGSRVEMLVPASYAGVHVHHREAYFSSPRTRPMAVGDLTLRGLRADGSELPVQISLSPLKTAEGMWVIAVIRDVTVQRSRVDALSAMEKRFRTSVESLDEALTIMTAVRDAHGKIIDFRWEFANEAQAKLVGVPADELVGRSLTTDFGIRVPVGVVDAYRNVVETGVPWENPVMWDSEFSQGHDDWAPQQPRGPRAFKVRASKLEDGVIVVQRDVTDEVLQEEVLALRTAVARGTDALQKCSRMEEAIEIMGRVAPHLFEDTTGAVFSPALRSDGFACVATWNEFDGHNSLAPDDCWALRTSTCHVYGDDPFSLRCSHATADAKWTACIPIVGQGEVQALIHFEKGEPAYARFRDLLEVLSVQWGLTVSNLRLKESLREQTIRDALTGLFNRRYLDDALEREVLRAQRHQSPLSLVMLDLDYFKHFNDRFGHPEGDVVLRDFGRFLLESTRGSDIVGRFGGEEFMLLMPAGPPTHVIGRVASLLEDWRLRGPEAGGRPHPTVSAGVAFFAPGQRGYELLGAADEALYEAKAKGRDQLAVARSALHASDAGGVTSPFPQLRA